MCKNCSVVHILKTPSGCIEGKNARHERPSIHGVKDEKHICMCIYIYRNIGQNNETTSTNFLQLQMYEAAKADRKKYLHRKAHKPYRNVSKLHYLKCSYFLTNCLTISITKKKSLVADPGLRHQIKLQYLNISIEKPQYTQKQA